MLGLQSLNQKERQDFRRRIKYELESNAFRDPSTRNQKLTHFAWICALRALPFLGADKSFSFWLPNVREKNLLSIFEAIDLVALMVNDSSWLSNGGYIANLKKSLEKTDEAGIAAAGGARIPYAATDTISFACRVAIGDDIVQNAANAADALVKDRILVDRVYKDIQAIKSNDYTLLNSDINLYGESLINQYLNNMKELNCLYWACLYYDLPSNQVHFSIDQEMLYRRLINSFHLKKKGVERLSEIGEELEKLPDGSLLNALAGVSPSIPLRDLLSNIQKAKSDISLYEIDEESRKKFKEGLDAIEEVAVKNSQELLTVLYEFLKKTTKDFLKKIKNDLIYVMGGDNSSFTLTNSSKTVEHPDKAFALSMKNAINIPSLSPEVGKTISDVVEFINLSKTGTRDSVLQHLIEHLRKVLDEEVYPLLTPEILYDILAIEQPEILSSHKISQNSVLSISEWTFLIKIKCNINDFPIEEDTLKEKVIDCIATIEEEIRKKEPKETIIRILFEFIKSILKDIFPKLTAEFLYKLMTSS